MRKLILQTKDGFLGFVTTDGTDFDQETFLEGTPEEVERLLNLEPPKRPIIDIDRLRRQVEDKLRKNPGLVLKAARACGIVISPIP